MANTNKTKTSVNDQLNFDIIIKKEQKEFKGDQIEETLHQEKENYTIKDELINEEEELSRGDVIYYGDKNTLNQIKEEELYDETNVESDTMETNKTENKTLLVKTEFNEPCIQVVKQEYQNSTERNENDFLFIEKLEEEEENNGSIKSEHHSDSASSLSEEELSTDTDKDQPSGKYKNRPYQCDKCEKNHAVKRLLTRHASTHNINQPFKCNVCDMGFAKELSFLQHTVTHTGEKPFKCDKCSKTFLQKKNFDRHALTHTNQYKCIKCEKMFAKKQHLIQHAVTHRGEKPYRCKVCQKSFSLKSNFANHFKLHAGDRPFKCDKCDQSFVMRGNLQQHMLVHTKRAMLKMQKPFKCDKCDKSYKHTRGLELHARRHSEGKTSVVRTLCTKES